MYLNYLLAVKFLYLTLYIFKPFQIKIVLFTDFSGSIIEIEIP